MKANERDLKPSIQSAKNAKDAKDVKKAKRAFLWPGGNRGRRRDDPLAPEPDSQALLFIRVYLRSFADKFSFHGGHAPSPRRVPKDWPKGP